MLSYAVRALGVLLCLVGSLGATFAYKSNHAYLGIKLLALAAVALPVMVYSDRFATVLRQLSRSTIITLSVVGVFLLCLIVVVLFPRQFFHMLHDLFDRTPPA
jgi:hypothetical protein